MSPADQSPKKRGIGFVSIVTIGALFLAFLLYGHGYRQASDRELIPSTATPQEIRAAISNTIAYPAVDGIVLVCDGGTTALAMATPQDTTIQSLLVFIGPAHEADPPFTMLARLSTPKGRSFLLLSQDTAQVVSKKDWVAQAHLHAPNALAYLSNSPPSDCTAGQ